MVKIANSYLEAGGVMVEVFNTLYLLEIIYPLDILEKTVVELHHYGSEKYYDKLCYYTLWCRESILYLLWNRGDWLKHWHRILDNDPEHLMPYYKYDASFDSHVSFTLAHEWGHIIEREGAEFDGISIPKNYCLTTSEDNADILACSFVDMYMKDILDLNKEPKIFQQSLDTLGGQLILNLEPLPR